MTIQKLKLNFASNGDYFSDDELLKFEIKDKDGIVDFLILQLSSTLPGVRNRSALYLRKIKSNRAVNPLFSAILNPLNENYIGTLVYALEALDCRYRLVDLFRVLFFGSFEAKMSAFAVLEEQVFEFSKDDLLLIQKLWINREPNKDDDDKTVESMKEIYEDFISYL